MWKNVSKATKLTTTSHSVNRYEVSHLDNVGAGVYVDWILDEVVEACRSTLVGIGCRYANSTEAKALRIGTLLQITRYERSFLIRMVRSSPGTILFCNYDLAILIV